MRIHTIVPLLLLTFAAPMLHAECSVDKPEACTIPGFRVKVHQAGTRKALAAASAAVTEKKVGDQNRATTTPDLFAARIHNSYQDFITPFAFAINKIEESQDGRALILRFNTIREGPVKLGFTGTAAKPALYDKIKTNVSAAQRDAVAASLDKKLKDFDDVTIAASLAFEKAQCDPRKAFCFGRNPKTYQNALATLLTTDLMQAAILGTSRAAEDHDLILKAFIDENVKQDETMADFEKRDADLYSNFLKLLDEQEKLDIAASVKSITFLKTQGIANLATLIDNQPQLSFTGSWRSLGDLGGPDELATTVEYQCGSNNLNSASKDLTTALTMDPEKQPSQKWVFTASYKRSTHYRLDSLAGTGVTLPDGATFAAVDVPRTSEWQGKAQWGMKLGAMAEGQQRSRLDVSGEFQRNSKGGIRTKNRFVATATLTVPLTDNASFPLSVKYANKPEFLTDTRKDVSVHFGISYRFPWEPKPST